MTGTNTSENMKVEMPSTNQSGDPETTEIPQVIDEKKTTVKNTSTQKKTNPRKPKTEK